MTIHITTERLLFFTGYGLSFHFRLEAAVHVPHLPFLTSNISSAVDLVMVSLGCARIRWSYVISRVIGIPDASAIPGPVPVAVAVCATPHSCR